AYSATTREAAPPRVMRKRSTAHDDRGRHMATVKSSCHRLILFAFALSLLSSPLAGVAKEPMLAGVGAAMQEMVAKNEIAGAVTVVVTPDKIVHFETTGFAEVAAKKPMRPDTLFWIASMTKPITAVAILMLQ